MKDLRPSNVLFFFILTFFTMSISCMSTAEREQRKQWELEGRNIKTGLFDEPLSGRSFQEKYELEEFKTTENHQRFLVRFSENQTRIDEQNRLIDAENVEINRRNTEINRNNNEIDREISLFRDSAQKEFENWKETQLRRFNLFPDPARAFANSGRSGNASFEMKPINRAGLVIDGYIATGHITINGQVVFNDTRRIFPTKPFPPKQQTESLRSRVRNTMVYNPNTMY